MAMLVYQSVYEYEECHCLGLSLWSPTKPSLATTTWWISALGRAVWQKLVWNPACSTPASCPAQSTRHGWRMFWIWKQPGRFATKIQVCSSKPWPMRCKRGLPMSWQMRMAKMWKWMMTVRVNRWHAIICHVTVDDATGLRWMQGRAGGARWKKQSFRASFIRRIVEPCFRLLLSSFLRGLKPGITRMHFSKNTTWLTFTTRWARSRWF